MPSYAPGTPSWVDLATTDLDSSIAFYGGLFDWTTSEGREEFGGYRNFLSDGQAVAGLNPMGEVTAWSSFVSVADADATVAKVTDAGGAIIAAPMDVGDLGRMAVFTDREGVVIGLWQPGTFAGAEKVNAPGSLCWNELNSRDVDAAKAFYPAVFGWEAADHEMMPGFTYTTWNLGGRGIAGALPMPDNAPADGPFWFVWFAVADRDRGVARAEELGADVLMAKLDMEGVGKLGVLRDPQGAIFGIMQPEAAGE